MQDHDKICQIIWLSEGVREFHSSQFLSPSFSGSFEAFLRAVPCVSEYLRWILLFC